MLPTASKGRAPSATRQPNPVFQYLRRIVKWQQMDIEYTFWQMLHLCTSPKVVLLLTVSTLAYCAAYDHSFGHAVYVVISVLLFHFLLTGLLLATSCWLYAFDVHCNAFFPMFVLLYVVHYFFSPLLVAHGFIPELLSNLLFMVAASYYHYLSFLGYDVILSGFNPSRYVMNIYFSQWL
ncbi:unc-50-like protein [Drosera capensis]